MTFTGWILLAAFLAWRGPAMIRAAHDFVRHDLPHWHAERRRRKSLPEIRCDDHLSTAEYAALAGEGLGVRHWWLLDADGRFLPIGMHRGDRPLNTRADLTAGRTYTLGVGRLPHARRFTVTREGSRALLQTKATDGPQTQTQTA